MATDKPNQTTQIEGVNLDENTVSTKQLAPDQATYIEEYYMEQPDGSFKLVKTIEFVGTIDADVALSANGDMVLEWENVEAAYSRYFLTNLDLSVLTGTVVADGTLTLKLYLTRSSDTLRFLTYRYTEYRNVDVKFGADIPVPEAPVREGCEFVHWVEIPDIPIFQRQSPPTGCDTVLLPGSVVAEFGSYFDTLNDTGIYVPVYDLVKTTPNPEPEPTIIPEPIPARTCQDDGYASGYYWDGSACVLPNVYVVPNTGLK